MTKNVTHYGHGTTCKNCGVKHAACDLLARQVAEYDSFTMEPHDVTCPVCMVALVVYAEHAAPPVERNELN